ncbi:hypothetical protein DEA8626_03305 [Defluviimonas aquaemixtae]|uniref:ORC1/DEAH AAA+ ATPase domain-containing protein n=1 Tax=Albidovulum aquaemixtae TaxID=1542388 RepID=A0A2R8BLM8_9RHOB|nr:hypothetical protein DEA8626_03305 [Defluviimonas aquaemixtae]
MLAFDRLGFAIKSRAPLTVFTGVDGTGRTTLLRELVERNKEDMLIGMLSDPDELAGAPSAAVLRTFGEPQPPAPEEYHREELSRLLDASAEVGSTPVLLIDDADRLSDETLRAVCRLIEGGSGERPEIKLILAGPPELFEWLYRRSQLLVGPTFELTAMSKEDTAGYVGHILKSAGMKPGLFDAEALSEIHRRTGGVPVKINAVCEGCLNQACEEGVAEIGRGLVRRVVITHGTRGLIHQLEIEREAEPRFEVPDEMPDFDASAPLSTTAGVPLVPESQPTPAIPREPAEAGVAPKEPTAQRQHGASLANALKAFKKTPGASSTVEPRVRSRIGALSALARPAPGESSLERLRRKMSSEPDRSAPMRPESATVSRERHAAPSPRGRRRSILAGSASAVLLVAVGAALWSAPDGSLRNGLETVKLQTVSLFGGASEMRAQSALSAVPERAPPAVLDRIARIRAAVAGVPDDAGARFRQAIEAAGEDAEIAVVSYARAALVGHDRAAYYLGQIFETGEGVPVDRSLARAWYKQAGSDFSGAVKLLGALPPPEIQGALSAPIQLYGGQEPSGSVELIWTSGEGRDPTYYRVELADAQGRTAMSAQPLTISALRLTVPEGVLRWRVVAVSDDPAAEATSPWLPIGEH